MQTSTKAALGAGAATFVGSLVGQGLAVARTAKVMNAQIDADCDYLARHGYLPDVPPALPLSVPPPRSKVGIFLRCWAVGSASIFLLIFLGSLVAALTVSDPQQPVALNAVGGGFVGLIAGLLGGWLPALVLFAILASRENAQRAESAVVSEFVTYWQERTEAMHVLRTGGRDARTVLGWLSSFRLPLDDDA